MGALKFDNPLIIAMIKIANLMIVSFFWLVCCLPVVTIIPACTALFHTTSKVINGTGSGVVRDFFLVFKGAIKQGFILSAIIAASGLVIYTALDFGGQMWDRSFIWSLYYAIGFLIAFIWISMVIWIPPALSRFDAKNTAIVRLALYFASRSLTRDILMIVLLTLVAFLADFYPIAILILPGLYADLIHSGVEKVMTQYMEENGLVEDDEEDEDAVEDSAEPLTSIEFDKIYNDERD